MDYYEILGVAKDSSESDIKKAYYKLARENHPDKASDDKREEATKNFQKIGEAYEVLSNEEKRKIYDLGGKEALKGGGMPTNMDPFEMFNMFGGNFNFGPFQQHNQQKRQNGISKNKETVFPLNISLKDAYTGKTKKLKITKKIIIDKNTKEHVSKNLEKTWEKCSTCQGHGIVNEIRQIGPGMMTQMQKHCPNCSGKGYTLLKEYSIEEISEVIEIVIPKGVNNNHEIRIPDQGNVVPGTYPGDLLIVLAVPNKENEFNRNGNDLYYEKSILLSEALCGSSFKITSLDDRILYISFSSAIPGEHKTVKNEGIKGGNLIIVFDIIFPSSLDKEKRREIRKILPNTKEKSIKDKDDIVYSI